LRSRNPAKPDLTANAATVKALLARLGELAATREQTDSAPIRRAMENLRTVSAPSLGRRKGDEGYAL
jgi:hypothetical protein